MDDKLAAANSEQIAANCYFGFVKNILKGKFGVRGCAIETKQKQCFIHKKKKKKELLKRHVYQVKRYVDLKLPGRGHDGGPPHPGCAAEKGESILYATASFPASPPESPQQSLLAPPASRSDKRANSKQDLNASKHEITVQRLERLNTDISCAMFALEAP